MGSQRLAKARATIDRLDRQAVSLERLDVLAEKARRLSDAGITYSAIAARRNEFNKLADEGVLCDFNDALELLYDETFGALAMQEER